MLPETLLEDLFLAELENKTLLHKPEVLGQMLGPSDKQSSDTFWLIIYILCFFFFIGK